MDHDALCSTALRHHRISQGKKPVPCDQVRSLFDDIKKVFNHNDEGVRAGSVETVAALGHACNEISEETIALLGSALRDDAVTSTVIRSLNDFGLQVKSLIPQLASVARNHKDYSVRGDALRILRKIGSPSESVPVLADALNDEEIVVRLWAAELLGEMGHDAEAALPALRKAASSSPYAPKEVVQAIERIQGASLRP